MISWLNRIRLRTLIISAFALQAIIAVILTEGVAIWNVSQTSNRLALQMQNEASVNLQRKVGVRLENTISHLNSLHIFFNNPNDRLTKGSSQTQSIDLLAQRIQLQKNIRWVNIGYEKSGELFKAQVNSEGYSIQLQSGQDAREESWYTISSDLKSVHWTTLKQDESSADSLLIASMPFYDLNDRLIGVASIALEMASIVDILEQEKVGVYGEAFLFDRNGKLIASRKGFSQTDLSEDQLAKQIIDGSANESKIKDSMKAFYSEFGDIDRIHQSCPFHYESQNQRRFALFVPLENVSGTDWIIGLVTEEDSFLHRLSENLGNIFMLCAAATGLAIALGLLLSKWISDPVNRLNAEAKNLAAGTWTSNIRHDRKDEIGELSDSFNSMAFQLSEHVTNLEIKVRDRTKELDDRNLEISRQNKELVEANLQLEKLRGLERKEKIKALADTEKAQLEALRSQLNPHFLFNALNSIHVLLQTESERAADMTMKLANLCRITLAQTRENLSTVNAEATMLQNYLDLEKFRWEDRLEYTITINVESPHLTMPPFVFQPLVENAIKYGPKTSPIPLTINIDVRQSNGKLYISIENTGTWFENDSASSTRIGLDNLVNRLEKLYPGENSFSIEKKSDRVRINIEIPAREG